VRRGGTALANRVLVAAGGGGRGGGYDGGPGGAGGGTTGADGGNPPQGSIADGSGGQGGGPTSGGVGGSASLQGSSEGATGGGSGAWGAGGAGGGGVVTSSGGGGGGDYYGGGGGGGGGIAHGTGAAAGGGGSSFVDPAATAVTDEAGAHRGAGLVVIRFQPAAPPTASITTPASGGRYSLGKPVPTSFTCREGVAGPGLQSCNDSNGARSLNGGRGRLDTSTIGHHTYTVMALSQDGQSRAASIAYTVAKPTSGAYAPFQADKVRSGGLIRVRLKCPRGSHRYCIGTLRLAYRGPGQTADDRRGAIRRCRRPFRNCRPAPDTRRPKPGPQAPTTRRRRCRQLA
jgi:hypothetical protein